MGRKRHDVEAWCRVVFATRKVPDATKVLLLLLARNSRVDRYRGLVVSKPRAEIAEALGVAERRVDERVKLAHDAGFMTTIEKGYRGHTAVYGLMFPDHERARDSVALSDRESASSTSALSMPDSVALSPVERARDSVAPIGKRHASLTACEPCGGAGCARCCGEAV